MAPSTVRVRPLMWVLGGIAMFGGVMTVVIASQGIRTSLDSRALGGGATMFAAGGFGFVYLWLWLRNARLLVGLDSFGFQDILGRRHIWSASEVGAVVDVAIAFTKRQAARRAVFFIGVDGRRLLALNRIAWSATSIDRLVRATGKPLQVRSGAVPAVEFRREFPKAVPWIWAHSTLSGTLLAILLITLPIALAVVVIR